MAVARMRHHNSPEELQRRAAEGEQAPRKGKEFRHYNHPAEIAKREAAGQAGTAVAVVPRRAATPAAPVVWPPPGTVDNTESVSVSEAPAKRPTQPPPRGRGDVETRLRRIENLLWTFVESPDEAREFRRLLNNLAAVTDVQLDINNRVRAIEDQIEAALAESEGPGDGSEEGDDDDADDQVDDDQADEVDDAAPLEPLTDDDSPPPGEEEPAELAPAEPTAEALEPPPTVPDNPPKGEAT